MNQSTSSLHRTGSRPPSTMSRSQSLIKKNMELQDLKPADVLIERFVAWKAIVKQLTAYFEGIADIENNTSKELVKLAGLIQVPFKSGNQFLGEGGLQDVYYAIRDNTRTIADQHANLGRTIDSSIVEHLRKLGSEVKAHIRNVQNDTGKLAAGVAKERETSTRLVGELANAVSMYKNTPMNIPARSDPFIANQAVARQLQRQVLEENLLQKSIVIMQQNSADFEQAIVHSIQSAWQTFHEWRSIATAASQKVHVALAAQMASLTTDREWIAFAARSDHLLDPETPLRDPEYILYPLKDDPSVQAVHRGHLGRKSNFTRAYKESYYVLSPAGFLHEFVTSDATVNAGQTPTFSLFLPNCTLGPASPPNAKSHKFHIEGRKDGAGTIKAGGFKGLLGGGGDGAKAWSFRARSHEEMMEWWNDVRMLCARYLVASESVKRSGPVEAAVRAVGYNSEEEGEWAGEGSSVEEEEDEGEAGMDDLYAEAPPGYTHPKHFVEIGPNGYAIDKKGIPPPVHGYGEYYDASAAPPPVGTGTFAPHDGNVQRRLSRRKMEKAPEGREPIPEVDRTNAGVVDTHWDVEDHHREEVLPPPQHQLQQHQQHQQQQHQPQDREGHEGHGQREDGDDEHEGHTEGQAPPEEEGLAARIATDID